MDIASIVTQCESHLDSAVAEFKPGEPPRLEIPLGWRVRLWAAMNEAFPDNAPLRRGMLAYAVAQQATAEWDRVAATLPADVRGLPHLLLDVCRKTLRGELTEGQALRSYNIDQVESAMGLEEDIGLSAYAPLAAHAAIKCAVSNEEAIYREWFYAKVNDAAFLSVCEESRAHFWAACAAGGFPGSSRYDQRRRTEFWRRWLREDLPAVLGDLQSLRRSIRI